MHLEPPFFIFLFIAFINSVPISKFVMISQLVIFGTENFF